MLHLGKGPTLDFDDMIGFAPALRRLWDRPLRRIVHTSGSKKGRRKWLRMECEGSRKDQQGYEIVEGIHFVLPSAFIGAQARKSSCVRYVGLAWSQGTKWQTLLIERRSPAGPSFCRIQIHAAGRINECLSFRIHGHLFSSLGNGLFCFWCIVGLLFAGIVVWEFFGSSGPSGMSFRGGISTWQVATCLTGWIHAQ